ncbi:hypothetical protein AAFF_G00424800 [Aldrovandia affinis]|uniref:Uncharacterized protein n=1 Tax=Aldrovandia affinis TaxID=143900 RepID=A0AAD7X076_9TELE|nr:hypothetical protein AAFF_G00424800 [Aldrovandia affinis]
MACADSALPGFSGSQTSRPRVPNSAQRPTIAPFYESSNSAPLLLVTRSPRPHDGPPNVSEEPESERRREASHRFAIRGFAFGTHPSDGPSIHALPDRGGFLCCQNRNGFLVWTMPLPRHPHQPLSCRSQRLSLKIANGGSTKVDAGTEETG